ncbi:MAG TPA: Lrp/AsnC family transcriptional regulator [Azospirillaceae bacterium]|nr:Lrp/AsnC family transcriptional regulator [Azospirillaceae bacterium]
MSNEPTLDALDRSLLARVQEDARLTAETLGAEIGLSAAAVQRRLKRMRDEGIILREIAQVSPRALGQRMTFIVAVEMERERADILDAFRRRADAEPNVQQCYYVTGEADFFLVIVARDMDEFEALSRRLFQEDSHVRRFRTSIVMGRAKVGVSIPVG